MKKLLLAVIVIAMLSVTASWADVINVSAGGSIQAAVSSAAAGDVIQVAAGIYAESIVIDKPLSIIGSGNGTSGTILRKIAAPDIIKVLAPVTIKNLRIEPVGVYGLNVPDGANVNGMTIDGVKVIGSPDCYAQWETEVGFNVGATASVKNLTVRNSSFENCDYGWYFFKKVDSGLSNNVSDVIVSNTQFLHNDGKGIYVEKLSDATFENVTCSYNGTISFWNATWNNGFDINLKGAVAYKNIRILNSTFIGNGIGYKEGVAIAVKARDDGATYGVNPASLNNVVIKNCLIQGNERGIRFGEPGKNNATPTNASVSFCNFISNVKTYAGTDGSAYGDVINQSASAVNAENNWWGTTIGAAAGSVFGTVDSDPWLRVPAAVKIVAGSQYAAASHAAAVTNDRCIGAGAWKATGAAPKGEVYFVPQSLFGYSIKISDIASITYNTKKSGAQGDPDWYIAIYTAPLPGDAGWYHSRLNMEPYYSINLNGPAGQWNTWSTDPGTNQLRIFDSTNGTFGSYTCPTFDVITSGPVNWANYAYSGRTDIVDYTSQTVKYLSFQVGTNMQVGFEGLIDGITIRLKNGEAVIIDLESDSAADALYLDVNPGSLFVKPGDKVDVSLKMSDLSRAASGYQAFMSFDPKLSLGNYSFTSVPFGLPIYSFVSGNNIDLAAGVDTMTGQIPSAASAPLVDFGFLAGTTEGTAQVTFRNTVPGSMLSDDQGQEIITSTGNSQIITIDGSAPANVTISSNPASWTNGSSAVLSFSATDALSGIGHYELSIDNGVQFVAVSPYTLDISGMATGQHSAKVIAYDKAGNYAEAATTIFVDRTAPVVTIDSAVQGSVNLFQAGTTAIQGDVKIRVTATDPNSGLPTGVMPTVTVGSDDISSTGVAVDSDTWEYTYTVTAATANGAKEINASIADNLGIVGQAAPKSFSVNKTQAAITVTLQGVQLAEGQTVTRKIKIVIGGTGIEGATKDPIFCYADIEFNASGVGTFIWKNLPYDASWTRISAKDEQHTLRKAVDLSVDGNLQYSASISLIGGDATSDNLIDIRDFGVFAGQWGLPARATGRDADFNCSSTVETGDFTYFMGSNFLAKGDDEPVKAMAASMAAASAPLSIPVSSISVKDLAAQIGMKDARKADMNNDGIVNTTDVQLFANKYIRGKK